MRSDEVEGSGPGREEGSSVSTPVNRGPRIVRLHRTQSHLLLYPYDNYASTTQPLYCPPFAHLVVNE
jgi:hypothetical protein